MTLTTTTEKETATPKPASEPGRGIGFDSGKVPSHQIPSRLTNYDRWVRYQRLPKGKNARKRLNWRIQRESAGLREDTRGQGDHSSETSKRQRKGKA